MSYLDNTAWTTEVATVRGMMDPSYDPMDSVTIGNHAMGWCRTGVQKFCDRVIPVLTGAGPKTLAARSTFKMAVNDSVAFGNSTLVVNGDGSYRVTIPENAAAYMDPFGHVIFNEQHTNMVLKGVDGRFSISEDAGKTWTDASGRTFTLFSSLDTGHPNGQSRISKSTRYFVKEAQETYKQLSTAKTFHSTPQVILNKVFAELLPHMPDITKRIRAGSSTAVVIPEGPDGKEVKVETIEASDLTAFATAIKIYREEVASNFNIDVSELGESGGSNPRSADALYAAKEDLIIEVKQYEEFIKAQAQAFFSAVAKANKEPEPMLDFAPPATPSPQSAADYISKLVTTFPAIKYSRAAMNMAYLPQDVINDLMDGDIQALAEADSDEQLL